MNNMKVFAMMAGLTALFGAIGMIANFAMFFDSRDEEGSSNPVAGLAMMILAPLAESGQVGVIREPSPVTAA